MKKIIIAFAALAAAFSLVSCNKEQIEIEPASLKLNITVNNLDDAIDTKAIKTSWADGDKLNIWFDQTNYTNPDLVLTYSGGSWTASALSKTPNASGNLIVLYEGNNDWSMYRHNNAYFYPTTTENISGAGAAYAQPIAYTNRNSIPYSYESYTLTANLNSWKSLTQVQVVVTGLTSAPSNYALKVTDLSSGSLYISNTSVSTSNVTKGGYTLGVHNADGVAFCFVQNTQEADHYGFTFTLKDISTGTEKTCTVADKQIVTSSSKVAGVKIDVSKFE